MSECGLGALRLVCITPGDREPAGIETLVRAALSGGVTAVLLREPQLAWNERRQLGRRLAALCQQADASLLVSNDLALAQECGAAGIHLGHAGPNVTAVRQEAPGLIIGRSAHWPLVDEDRSADYVTLSPVAETRRSWPRPLLTVEQLERAIADPDLGPVVALGGLDSRNVDRLPADVAGIAVIRALSEADDAAEAAGRLRRAFDGRMAVRSRTSA
jgi:thiamine-phosphate pyrophosphorylase